jgi:RNA polymerase sigma factor (sigma-70 family)
LVRNDPLLSPLRDATAVEQRRGALEALIVERVRPLAHRIVARFRPSPLRDEDAEDLESAIHLRAVRRLQQFAETPGDVIERLDDYVATIAYNVVHDFFRARYPERTRLKNRLRYLFAHDPDLAVWESEGGAVCGLKSWRGRPPLIDTDALIGSPLDADSPASGMRALFERSAAPLYLDDVVRLAAEAQGIADVRVVEERHEAATSEDDPESRAILRLDVQALWREVRELPQRQRAALLLNLRDQAGHNALGLLVLTGVATLDEIAEAIGISTERLSVLWSGLPLDDLTTASMLGVTRQQVINLRKSAKERLARRLEKINRRRP